MLYRVEVNMTEQDYIDYNKFHLLKSHYGKKQIKNLRILICVLLGIPTLMALIGGRFNKESIISVLPFIILFVIFQAGLLPFLGFSLKGTVLSLKKSGKMAFSPHSVIEFFEESFCETTEDNKTEHKYTAIERISVVNGKIIYIHINNVMAYIVPVNSFETGEQYSSFLAFLKSKCSDIDFY